jgi:hypothetical protein
MEGCTLIIIKFINEIVHPIAEYGIIWHGFMMVYDGLWLMVAINGP